MPRPPLRNINMTQFKTKVPEWRCFVVCEGQGKLFQPRRHGSDYHLQMPRNIFLQSGICWLIILFFTTDSHTPTIYRVCTIRGPSRLQLQVTITSEHSNLGIILCPKLGLDQLVKNVINILVVRSIFPVNRNDDPHFLSLPALVQH